MKADWSCRDCDSHNGAVHPECRVCGASRAAGGVVRHAGQGAGTEIVRRPRSQPVFVESRHAAPPRPVQAPDFRHRVPDLVSPRAPVVRPPVTGPVAPERSKGGPGWWVVALLAIAAIAILVGFLVEEIQGAPGSGATGTGDSGYSSQPESQASACPSEVASYLPYGGGDAVHIVSYTSQKHDITVCQADDGNYYYDGRVRGREVSADTHLTLPARRTTSGFVATNGDYRYELTDAQVTVTQAGKLLHQSAVTRVGP